MKIIIILVAYCFYIVPSFLLAETSENKELFQKICSGCHKLPVTENRTAKQWQLIVDVMQGIMLQRGVAVLSESEKQQVLLYLQQSTKSLASANTTEAEDIFVTRCALCHQLPEPAMLNIKQWKLIIKTMQLRMQQVGMPQLTDQESRLVLKYLAEQVRE